MPRVTGREAIQVFERAGFVVDRIKGSHHIMKKPGHRYHLSVPLHGNRNLGKGLLKALIEAAGISMEQFTQLLNA